MGTLILNVALLGDSREAYRGYISRTTTHITHPIPSVYVCNVNRRVFHNAKSVGIYHYKSQQHTIQSKKMKSLRITRLVNVEFQHIHGPTKVLTYKLQSLLIQLSRTNNLVRPKFQKNHNFKVFSCGFSITFQVSSVLNMLEHRAKHPNHTLYSHEWCSCVKLIQHENNHS